MVGKSVTEQVKRWLIDKVYLHHKRAQQYIIQYMHQYTSFDRWKNICRTKRRIANSNQTITKPLSEMLYSNTNYCWSKTHFSVDLLLSTLIWLLHWMFSLETDKYTIWSKQPINFTVFSVGFVDSFINPELVYPSQNDCI